MSTAPSGGHCQLGQGWGPLRDPPRGDTLTLQELPHWTRGRCLTSEKRQVFPCHPWGRVTSTSGIWEKMLAWRKKCDIMPAELDRGTGSMWRPAQTPSAVWQVITRGPLAHTHPAKA